MAAGKLQIYVLNVGQGNSVLIIAPDGGTILVDCYDGAKTARLLNNLGLDRIDLLATTHPHYDHIKGVPHILEKFHVTEWWDSGAPTSLPTYREILELCMKRHIRPNMIKGLNFEKIFGEMTLKVISPSLNHRRNLDRDVKANNNRLPSKWSYNDYSFVLSVRYDNFNMILGADAEISGWASVINELPEELKCQVLLMPHHGSVRGGSYQLLEKMSPFHLILSYGASNHYSHPDQLTLNILDTYKDKHKENAHVWKTPEHGTILVESNGSSRPRVESFKETVFSDVPI